MKNSSRNVKIIIFKTLFGSVGRAIYFFVSSFIIYALNGDNSLYGTVSAIAGFIGLMAVLLAGTLSDKLGKRAWLLYVGISLETFGLFCYSFATSIVLVLIATSVISISAGFNSISTTTILADSTTSNEKNQIFSLFFLADNIAFGIGNLVAFIAFQNDSSLNLYTLLFALKIGFVFLLIEFFLSFLVKDKYLIETHAKNAIQQVQDTTNKVLTTVSKNISKKIPIIVITSGYVISFGAGISIIFLNRFFQIHYNLSLQFIAFISAIMIFFTGIWGKIMGDLADKLGRVFSIVSSQLVATFLLFILSLYPPLILGVITLLIRNAFMNASSPVSSALLTDNIPVSQRARWTSLSSLGWAILFSLGNIIGGYIIDVYDFNVAFFTTACLYLIGTLLLLLIKKDDKKSLVGVNG